MASEEESLPGDGGGREVREFAGEVVEGLPVGVGETAGAPGNGEVANGVETAVDG